MELVPVLIGPNLTLAPPGGVMTFVITGTPENRVSAAVIPGRSFAVPYNFQ